MAAPMTKNIKNFLTIFSKFSSKYSVCHYARGLNYCLINSAYRTDQLATSPCGCQSFIPELKVKNYEKNIFQINQKSHFQGLTVLTQGQSIRHFHTTPRVFEEKKNDDNNVTPSQSVPLRLSSWSPIIWPSVIKTIRNWFLTLLIRGYMDDTYSTSSFLDGAEQAINHVSHCLSEGHLDDLTDLVENSVIEEARHHLSLLSIAQKRKVAVNKEDMFLRYIHEIGMIFDDESDRRYVEITTVFQGMPGFNELKEKGDTKTVQENLKARGNELYICNYRFIREFTKGVEGDWRISRLNHFHPQEVAQQTSPFSR